MTQIATSYVGSQQWLDAGGINKCNLFVSDVIAQAGAQAPISIDSRSRLRYLLGRVNTPYYPTLAGEWASRGRVMECWHNVQPKLSLATEFPPDSAQPGDIIAEAIQYSDATGHVGIVVGLRQTASADSAAPCIPPGNPAGIVDISDYGFRLDDWVDQFRQANGQPCRSHGYKRNAVVKRFLCQ